MSHKYVILDTETTGISNKDEIIELSYIYNIPNLSVLGNKVNKYTSLPIEEEDSFTQRYRPTVPINKGAYEVHGISFKDLLTKPKSSAARLHQDTEYLIGHNISFDHRMLGKPDNVKLICSLSLVRILDKQLSLGVGSHKLDNCISFFYPDKVDLFIEKYHSSFLDCIKVMLLIAKLHELISFNVKTWEDIYNFQQKWGSL